MTVRRNTVAFGDLRGWIDALRKAGELHEVNAEVDTDFEIGTIMRLAQGPGTGPAMLFNNLKGYNKPESRCRRLFGSALLQWNGETDDLDLNLRLDFIHHPGADLFLVYNESRSVPRTPGEPHTRFREGIAKLTWLLQF